MAGHFKGRGAVPSTAMTYAVKGMPRKTGVSLQRAPKYRGNRINQINNLQTKGDRGEGRKTCCNDTGKDSPILRPRLCREKERPKFGAGGKGNY